MTITAGAKLGRYEIRSKIGVGGMGEVYRARDSQLDRDVALKVLPAEVATHRDRMERFVREARAAAALNHPNIAHIYEIGDQDGTMRDMVLLECLHPWQGLTFTGALVFACS